MVKLRIRVDSLKFLVFFGSLVYGIKLIIKLKV